MSEPIESVLIRAFSQNLEGPAGRDNIRQNMGGLSVLHLHLKEGVEMNWKVVAEHLIWDFSYTLRKNDELATRLSTVEAANAELKQELAEQEAENFALVQDLDRAGQSGACIQQLALNGVITTDQCEEMMQALSSADWHEYHRLPGSAPTRKAKPAPLLEEAVPAAGPLDRQKVVEALADLLTPEGEQYEDPLTVRLYGVRMAVNGSVGIAAKKLGIYDELNAYYSGPPAAALPTTGEGKEPISGGKEVQNG